MVMNVFLKIAQCFTIWINIGNIRGENGILFNDKDLNIKWKTKKPIISKRDRQTYSFAEFKK